MRRTSNLCISPLNNSLAVRIPSVSPELLTGLRMHLAYAHACQIPTLHISRFIFLLSPKPQPPGIARPEAVHVSPHIEDGTRQYVNFSVHSRTPVSTYGHRRLHSPAGVDPPALQRTGTFGGECTAPEMQVLDQEGAVRAWSLRRDGRHRANGAVRRGGPADGARDGIVAIRER